MVFLSFVCQKREWSDMKLIMQFAQGVNIETDVIVGRTITIDELLDTEGYHAVFIGSGAGLPKFMNIPGENLNGVVSANEFLTRTNLMKAFDPEYDTPVYVGKRVVVVGGGVMLPWMLHVLPVGQVQRFILFTAEAKKNSPARLEEVHHAKEENIIFRLLNNPTEILGDENGWVKAIRCIKMELGEPDDSGRRRPIEIKGSEFEIECDVVIMSLGTSPNPLIAKTTPGLKTESWGRNSC